MRWTIVMMVVLTSCAPEAENPTLTGLWHVEENSQLYGVQHYDVHISQRDTATLLIDNFYNIGMDHAVSVTLEGKKIDIPSQEVQGYIFAGTGEVSSDMQSILFTFTANDRAVIDHVVAQYKR